MEARVVAEGVVAIGRMDQLLLFQGNTLGEFNSRSQLDVFCSLLSCSGLHKQLCDLDVTILVGRHESSVVLFVLLIYPYLVFE